jgi:cyclic lactone autoinducer peptide
MRTKQLFLKISGAAAVVVTMLSVAFAGAASLTWFYQPKLPKCLQK